MGWTLIIALLSALGYLLMQGYIWRGWLRIGPQAAAAGPPLSVLVAAHDEADRLRRNLPSLLAQAYPVYEVLVVLDRCQDDSHAVVAAIGRTHPHLRYLEIGATPPGWSPKKWAIEQGIAAARYEHLVFTDADCTAGPDWLAAVGGRYAQGAELVLGIGRYARRAGLLNALIQWETFYAAFQYIGLAMQGRPYMAVGRNLAYTRAFFRRHGGLAAFRGSLSGDDDLLVNAYGRHARLAVVTDRAAQTCSEVHSRWRDWWRQKTRHVSAARHYDRQSRWVLTLFHGLHALHYLCLIGSALQLSTAAVALPLYVSRLVLSGWVFSRVFCQIGPPVPILWYPVLDLFFFLYNFSVVPTGLMKAPTWRTKLPKYPETPRKTASW
ncbi:MAG: glycosyltransferase [Bacteroidia bacterium]